MKQFLAALAVVLALGAGYLYAGSTVHTAYGAAAGPNHSNREYFNAGVTQGGVFSTTTNATTYTLTASDLRGGSVIKWLPNQNITISLGATSTYALIPNVGDATNLYFYNASTTQAASITFAAVDAGSDLQFAEATGGDLVLTGLDWEKVTLIRQTANKVTFILDEMTEAD